MSDRIDMAVGLWAVECIPDDGARLSRLAYDGVELLTREPADFRPPAGDFGAFERRPAYGYDDCFPSVDPCRHPSGFDVPDHGEVVWRAWDVSAGADRLTCRTTSERLPVTFTRELVFDGSVLQWQFEAANASTEDLPFMHVMHGLMPPREVVDLRLPACDAVVDESYGKPWVHGTDASVVGERLIHLQSPASAMLLLRGCRAGVVDVALRSGLSLAIEWPVALLPTLGIWWDVGAHPKPPGVPRFECALEPMAGAWSSLQRSLAEGDCQTVPAGGSTVWSITWRVHP